MVLDMRRRDTYAEICTLWEARVASFADSYWTQLPGVTPPAPSSWTTAQIEDCTWYYFEVSFSI